MEEFVKQFLVVGLFGGLSALSALAMKASDINDFPKVVRMLDLTILVCTTATILGTMAIALSTVFPNDVVAVIVAIGVAIAWAISVLILVRLDREATINKLNKEKESLGVKLKNAQDDLLVSIAIQREIDSVERRLKSLRPFLRKNAP